MDSRIKALEDELAALKSEKAAADADVPQDAAAPAQSTPAPAQSASAAPAAAAPAPMPLASPSMTAPLATAAPAHTFDGGPFKQVAITGILSGMGMAQDHWLPGDKGDADISNAQIFLQKTTGWFQFYLQGGDYNLLTVGVPFTKTDVTQVLTYGPLPLGYVKLGKGNWNFEIGKLPTLIGAEYTFSFENMNVERGLLWNQETAISRGIQFNDTYKKLTWAVSWNDGFYSNRYNWISGSMALAVNASNTLSFIAGGNAGQTNYSAGATPFLQNNGAIYNVAYTYSHEAWTITPYFQYTHVPENTKLGIPESGSTNGGALLLNYNFKHGISLAARPEYITSSGSATDPKALNLLGYGAGSNAFAFTVTPAYQKGGFFFRGDLSVVDARGYTAGDVFSVTGNSATQTRVVLESGFLF